jgi:hypothetical protein
MPPLNQGVEPAIGDIATSSFVIQAFRTFVDLKSLKVSSRIESAPTSGRWGDDYSFIITSVLRPAS